MWDPIQLLIPAWPFIHACTRQICLHTHWGTVLVLQLRASALLWAVKCSIVICRANRLKMGLNLINQNKLKWPRLVSIEHFQQRSPAHAQGAAAPDKDSRSREAFSTLGLVYQVPGLEQMGEKWDRDLPWLESSNHVAQSLQVAESLKEKK